jgi:hypothetical protein
LSNLNFNFIPNFQLSACLSHDELNKFAILMRRWRARQMPILEFAQKLLELYGPERRYLLASEFLLGESVGGMGRPNPIQWVHLCEYSK